MLGLRIINPKSESSLKIIICNLLDLLKELVNNHNFFLSLIKK